MSNLHATFFYVDDGCTYTFTLSVDDARRILNLADQPALTITLLSSIDGQAYRNTAQLVVTRLGSLDTAAIHSNASSVRN